MDMTTLYRDNLGALVQRARNAGLRDPETTAGTAVAKFLTAVYAGRLRADRESLFLVAGGVVRDELRSARHKMESPASHEKLRHLEAAGYGHVLVSSPVDADTWMFRTTLLDSLSRIEPKHRAAWLLTEVHGLSSRECGDTLGVHHVTACRWAEKARATLAQEVYHA
jgi:DNA-directed RNA polymerase specialized sigma24 family protein